jgi:hypothetical protein
MVHFRSRWPFSLDCKGLVKRVGILLTRCLCRCSRRAALLMTAPRKRRRLLVPPQRPHHLRRHLLHVRTAPRAARWLWMASKWVSLVVDSRFRVASLTLIRRSFASSIFERVRYVASHRRLRCACAGVTPNEAQLAASHWEDTNSSATMRKVCPRESSPLSARSSCRHPSK